MNNTRIGIQMSGNFTTDEKINHGDIDFIVKHSDMLFAKVKNREIKLIPVGNDAELIVRNFSSYDVDQNESIYDIKIVDRYIVIILYTFKNVKRIELPSETLHFYLDRMIKNELENKGIADEVKFMTDEFMNNKSVFTIEDYHGKTTKYFEMYGTNWRANCERERPGVYRIRKLYEYKTINRQDQITQLYGYIKFVTFDTAIRTKGNEAVFEQVNTNEIFKAWNEYLEFERELFEDDVKQKGFLKYSKFIVEGEEIVFTFKVESLAGTPLFTNSDNFEYDIVVLEGQDNVGQNIDDIMDYKNKSDARSIWLRKCKNESFGNNTARFVYPSIDKDIPAKGIIVLSDKSIKIEQKRRKKVMRLIEEKKNQTANMLMRLSAGESDSQAGSKEEPITEDVLYKMFGKRGMTVTENYREAMSIALNTPDLALIQGPPGTGKTTLIKGIISRLNAKGNKNYKILVSSEQHEALFNVVGKLSENKLIPPFVSSKKYASAGELEDEHQLEQNIEAFQNSFGRLCEDILRPEQGKSEYSSNLMQAIYCIQEIKANHFSLQSVKKHIESLNESIIKMNLLQELQPILQSIRANIQAQEYKVTDHIENTTEQQRIIRKINSQRIDKDVFLEDDGFYQLKELQRLLGKYGYEELLLHQDTVDSLNSENESRRDEAFKAYITYVDDLNQKLLPKEQNEFSNAVQLQPLQPQFENLSQRIKELSKRRKKDFNDIVEELKYRLLDIDNATEIVKNYTNIVGSTCAQAERSLDVTELREGKYDYVIIDEAARANPLDIMIPILLGIKVILVGDQMQLPHYVETQYIRKFQEEKEKYKAYDKELLQKSLFEVIYESVEKSYNEGRLGFKRQIRIQEQHRMHPIIGEFISNQFYGGTVKNGDKTQNNINDYKVFNSKNVVWVNVPITEGLEASKTSYYRVSEADRVVLIIENIVQMNPNRRLNIGVMSFYKGQVNLISEMLLEHFPEEIREQIECNTVDSYQGKEFDIVILSTVRSNMEQIASRSLGFIHYSKSRINVALSRAKRLLIVVGDSNTLGRNEVVSNYIDYVKKEGHYEEQQNTHDRDAHRKIQVAVL